MRMLSYELDEPRLSSSRLTFDHGTHSTVTDLAKFLGLSTSVPLARAV